MERRGETYFLSWLDLWMGVERGLLLWRTPCYSSDHDRDSPANLSHVTTVTQRTFTCSKSAIKTLEKVWNMFKVYNQNTRTTSGYLAQVKIEVSQLDQLLLSIRYSHSQRAICYMIKMLNENGLFTITDQCHSNVLMSFT